MTTRRTSQGQTFARRLLLLSLFSISIAVSSARAQEEEYGSGGGLFDETGSILEKEVFVVQKRFFPKIGRHELTAGILGGIPFDSFFFSMMGGAAYAYHFSQTFGVEAIHVLYGKDVRSRFSDGLKDNGRSPEIVRPKLLISSSLFWSPIYGKFAFSQDYIYHYDLYLIGGGGVSVSEQSQVPAGVLGVGIRFFLNRWMSTKAEFRSYIYADRGYEFVGNNPPTLTDPRLSTIFVLSIGWSIYFPKFSYNPLE